MFTLSHLGQVGLWPLQAVQLLSGDFRGLEVMEPYSEDPVILTTQKKDTFTVVSMIGKYYNKGIDILIHQINSQILKVEMFSVRFLSLSCHQILVTFL